MYGIVYELLADHKETDYTSRWIKDSDFNSVCCSNSKCQRVLDRTYYNEDFRFRKQKADIYSISCGGIYLVSQKFRKLIESNNLNNIEFKPLPKVKYYFILNINNIVKVNEDLIDASETCSKCNYRISTSMSKGFKDFDRHKTIRILEDQNEIKTGIFFTGVLFGSHQNYAPVIIVGTKTGEKIKKANLKGILLYKIIPSKAEN